MITARLYFEWTAIVFVLNARFRRVLQSEPSENRMCLRISAVPGCAPWHHQISWGQAYRSCELCHLATLTCYNLALSRYPMTEFPHDRTISTAFVVLALQATCSCVLEYHIDTSMITAMMTWVIYASSNSLAARLQSSDAIIQSSHAVVWFTYCFSVFALLS